MKHRVQALATAAALLLSGPVLATRHGGPDKVGKEQAVAGVTDPVCGMKVLDLKAAPRSVYTGTTYYFFSQEDKAKFDKDPEVYLKRKEG